MKVNSIQTTNSYYNQNNSRVSQKGNTTNSDETIVKPSPVPSPDVTQFKKSIKSDIVENPVKSIFNQIIEQIKSFIKLDYKDQVDYSNPDSIISYELARIY